jgi:TfoX/Sxy family transcriptional regulator of competence genes
VSNGLVSAFGRTILCMSAMPKPGADSVERFKRNVPDDPRVSLRPMFGNLSAFANGYMFAGLFGDDVFVRLDDSAQAAVIADGGRPFEVMPGRAMRGYVMLPDAAVRDDARLRSEIEQSLAYTVALPPKEAKPKAGKGGASG